MYEHSKAEKQKDRKTQAVQIAHITILFCSKRRNGHKNRRYKKKNQVCQHFRIILMGQ